MSSTLPPNPNFFGSGLIYNPNFFFKASDTLTQQEADLLYLKYPLSQSGQETITGKLNVIGSTTLSQLSVTDGTNSISITPTSNPATEISTTSDNSNTTCYIPFSKTTAGNNTSLFIDDTTGPLSYNPSTSTLTATNLNGSASLVNTTLDNSSVNVGYLVFTEANAGTGRTLYTADTTKILSYAPSTGTLSTTQMACAVMNQPSTNSTCNLWLGLSSGTINIGTGANWTTGSINIGTGTTSPANINIGNTASTNINLKSPVILSNILRSSTTSPSGNALNIGYQVNTLGASFTTTSLLASTNTNIYSVSFTSANYGTYLFIANAILTPADTTVERQVEISISTAGATIQSPHFAMQFIPKSGGSAPQLTLSRVIQIYADTTVYLVGYCQGTTASVQTTSNNGLFQYTRIA